MVSTFTKRLFYSSSVLLIKAFSVLGIALLLAGTISAQGISLAQLMHFANAGKRIDPLMRESGFRPGGFVSQHDTVAICYNYLKVLPRDEDTTKPVESISKQLLKYKIAGGDLIRFQTSLLLEHRSLLEELKKNGFTFTETRNDYLFQKGNVTVHCFSTLVDSNFVYTYYLQIKQLPKPADMVFAEDLFQLTSHEYLVAVFGSANVKKDQFYLPGNKTTPCSVLFPNTKYEAVFVWEDGPNYRNVLALRIGGDPRTKSLSGYQRSVEQNVWQSREGYYVGMGASELKRLGERTMISSNNFKTNAGNPANYSGKMGLLLGCMNCEGPHYIQADYSNLADSMDEGQKIYISTMIFAGNTPKQ